MDTTKATGSFIPTLITLIAGWTMPVNMACALPQNGAVASGGSTMTQPDARTMHINQTTDKAIINWRGYSIEANETVKYFQPGSGSISLNRVTGADPSLIYGQISANGQVWVINPNGLLIGQNAKVNVGGFLGSTLNVSDKDFLSGNYNFKATGSPLSAISNDGNIHAADGGYVVFVSPNISNSGNITANRGSVNMASGDDVTLTFANNGLINLVINKETAKDALGIDNSGTITADGGQIIISAKVASDALKTVVNNTGVIQARTIENHNGVIKLLGGMENNAVKIGGILDASAPNGGNGGFIEASAHDVILNNPSITAGAPFGKAGEWLIDPADLTIGVAEATAYNASLDAGTNVTVATSGTGVQAGNITVAYPITKSAGADATLTLQAHNNIVVNNGVAISSTMGRLNVIFDADSDASGAGNIQMKSVSSIDTNGGNITFGGGANPATTAAMGSGTNMLVNDIYGICLSNTSLNASAGNISLRGTGSAGVSNARGIYAYSGTSIQTTSGAIAINGTGGGNSYNNYGVDLQNSPTKISSASGSITVTGTGGGNGLSSNNYGIYLHDGAAIKSAGTATVTLNGTGGNGTDLNYGVYLQDLSNSGTTVSTVDGAISITGHGVGSGAGNDGIHIPSWTPPSGVSVKATGAGGITLNGTGAGGTNSNYGAYIENATISSASGLISITGAGGAGSGISNYGIFIDPSNITSASGNISISASGGNGENGILTRTSGANNLISGKDVTISANAPAGTNISLPGTTVTATGTTTITNTTPAPTPTPTPTPTPAPTPAPTTGGTTTTTNPTREYYEKAGELIAVAINGFVQGGTIGGGKFVGDYEHDKRNAERDMRERAREREAYERQHAMPDKPFDAAPASYTPPAGEVTDMGESGLTSTIVTGGAPEWDVDESGKPVAGENTPSGTGGPPDVDVDDDESDTPRRSPGGTWRDKIRGAGGTGLNPGEATKYPDEISLASRDGTNVGVPANWSWDRVKQNMKKERARNRALEEANASIAAIAPPKPPEEKSILAKAWEKVVGYFAGDKLMEGMKDRNKQINEQ